MEASPSPTAVFRLVTLGRIALETPSGEDADLARRRRKLAMTNTPPRSAATNLRA